MAISCESRRMKVLTSGICVITAIILVYQLHFDGKENIKSHLLSVVERLRGGGVNTSRSLLYRRRPWSPAVNVSESPSVEVSPSADVLISGYMRSGSSILGCVVGHRNDTFYWFEPLQHQFSWQYFRGRDQLCHAAQNTCRSTTDASSLDSSLRFLRDIYNCSFQSHWQKITDGMQGVLGGPSWKKYVDCRKHPQFGQQKCLNELTPVCKNMPYRVIKSLRLSLDNVATLLEDHPRLKIIHQFRDPRGQMNSHFHTSWFKGLLVNNGAIRQDASALCERMLYDIQSGKEIMKTYPGRFRFLQYEDFDVRTQLTKRLALYEFLGMSNKGAYHTHFIEHLTDKETKTVGNHPYVFRTSLEWPVVGIIDAECWKVYEELGYVRFDNDKEFRNLNISSSKDPLPYAVT